MHYYYLHVRHGNTFYSYNFLFFHQSKSLKNDVTCTKLYFSYSQFYTSHTSPLPNTSVHVSLLHTCLHALVEVQELFSPTTNWFWYSQSIFWHIWITSLDEFASLLTFSYPFLFICFQPNRNRGTTLYFAARRTYKLIYIFFTLEENSVAVAT